MVEPRGKATGAAGVLLALALGLAGQPLAAQDTFSLPPGTASPSARPAGPVDPDNPVVTTRPSPRPTATPTSQPQPSPAASPVPPRTAPSGTSSGPRVTPTPTPRPSASAAAAPGARPVADPPALPAPTLAPETGTVPAVVPAAPVALPPAVTPPADQPTGAWWPWAAGGCALLLAAAAGFLWLRRKGPLAAPPEIDFEPPVVARPAAAPLTERSAADESPLPENAPAPGLGGPLVPDGLELSLEARRLNISLMATTLAYTLRLSNHGKAPLSALALEGDMVAAHASLAVERQIASTELRLELRHALLDLAPGESAEFRGEMRLPLSAITPIRSGDAAYFVPLARLRVEAAQGADEQLVIAQTFVIGEVPEQSGGALRPFRLDLGPRTFSRLGQRAVG